MRSFWVWSAIAICAAGCIQSKSRYVAGEPEAWTAWKAKRHESIAGSNGWTTLIARHWLPEGRNHVGSNPTNDLVLPVGRVPASVGTFTRNGRTVQFNAAPGVVATVDGAPVQQTTLKTDLNQEPSKLQIGSLSFVIIERGERLGLRVRDPDALTRRQFAGLKYFPYDATWRLTGHFEPFDPARLLHIPDITGGTQDYLSPGRIVFTHDGKEHRLDVVEEPGEEDYFVIFKDATAGNSTYGAGRFLYVQRPDSSNRITIDFNRAYTPPCGFTQFATCPMPPRQNWLPFEVNAGELKPK